MFTRGLIGRLRVEWVDGGGVRLYGVYGYTTYDFACYFGIVGGATSLDFGAICGFRAMEVWAGLP